MKFSLSLLVCLTLATVVVGAQVTPEQVSKHLSSAFSKSNKRHFKTSIVKRDHLGLRTKTLVFAIGRRVYRVVFSSDGSVVVSLTSVGDIASTPIFSGKSSKVSVDEIINIIYSRELGRLYAPALKGAPLEQSEKDLEEEKVKEKKSTDGRELRWNRLMNRMASGDTVGISGSTGNLDQALAKATSLARAMDPCAQGRGALAPHKSAVADIALAMAAFQSGLSKGEGELKDRSREFKVKGSYSFLKELSSYREQDQAADMFRLIQETGSQTQELFRMALRESAPLRDSYALAAQRNFRAVVRMVGEKEAFRVVDRVLAQIAVDVSRFVELRKWLPRAYVVMDFQERRYYVDPTLSSPSQARYLLSLAAWYESQLQKNDPLPLVAEYNKLLAETVKIENANLDEADEKKLQRLQAEKESIGEKLFSWADVLYKGAAYPQ